MPPKISRREKIKRKRLERKIKKKHRPKVEKKQHAVSRRRIRRKRRSSPQLRHSTDEEMQAPDRDDYDINRMRKLLKLKKKNKGLPLSFKQDGLDCIH